MSTYWKCLAAYLTGWVIAQSLYNRLRHFVWDRHGYDPKEEIATHVAERLTHELELRDRPSRENEWRIRAGKMGDLELRERLSTLASFWLHEGHSTGRPPNVHPRELRQLGAICLTLARRQDP